MFQLEKLPQAKTFAIAPATSISPNDKLSHSILLDVVRIVSEVLFDRIRFILDDENLGDYLNMVWLLVRFLVNAQVNFCLVANKTQEELIQYLKGSLALKSLFRFMSDFISTNITFYFTEYPKYAFPLLFTIQVAASIPTQFPKLSEVFMLESLAAIFNNGISKCFQVIGFFFYKDEIIL